MSRAIVIFSDYNLHLQQGAAFERMKCYAKAVPELSFHIIHQNIVTHPVFSNSLIAEDTENMYIYPHIVRRKSYTYNNLFIFFDFITPISTLKKIRKQFTNDNTTLLIYSTSFPLTIIACLWSFIYKYTVVLEKNELKTGIVLNMSLSIKGVSEFLSTLFTPVRLISGLLTDLIPFFVKKKITISSTLTKLYFNNAVNVPILVDVKRFHPIQKKRDNLFVFLGAITPQKDGIGLLLTAFSIFLKNKNAKLVIIGEGNKKYIENIKTFIIDNELAEKIEILPPVNSMEVNNILPLYDYALLLRTNNIQTHFGFSTKLGEYLASGLPVLYTDVSDNCIYLKNKTHGFCMNNPTIDSIVKKLEEIYTISDDEYYFLKINARILAEEKFQYSLYHDKLLRILS